MPELYRLELRYIDELIREGIEYANKFLSHSFSNTIQYLFLSGGNWGRISEFNKGLPNLLKWIKKQIYLLQFKIDYESLIIIIESSSKVKELTFWFCEFEDLPKDKFYLDPNIDYRLANLNLFRSWQEQDTRFL